MKRTIATILVLAAGCDDALDQRLAIIDEPRILAVLSEPAEARPGQEVTYRAIVAGPGGEVTPDATWAFCLASKPPTEDNAVSAACLDDAALAALGPGTTVTAALPTDGCIRFGPDTPPNGFRPRDPDPTGGYYQPVRADVDALISFGLSRITCKLPTAPADVAKQYDVEYVANTNPVLDPIDPALADVAANTDVTLVASWPAETIESYLWYDPLARRLVERNESLRLSWFATGGSIDVDASSVDDDNLATSVSTTWHVPAAGPASLWFVLRDSRGGISVQHLDVNVR
jgi:hypothetical protein